LYIQIDKARLPVAGQHGCDHHEAQRGRGGPLADEFEGVIETPRSIRIDPCYTTPDVERIRCRVVHVPRRLP
jgi:hypothetical protein